MVRVSAKIKRLLVDAGLVSDADWGSAKEKGGSILEALLSSGVLHEDGLLEALGRASSIAPVDLMRCTPDPKALEALPQDSCTEYGILPLTRNGEILTIAVTDPFDVLLLDDLKRRTGCQIRQVVSQPAALKRAIDRAFRTGEQQVDSLLGEVKAGGELEVKVDKEKVQDLVEATADVKSEDAPAVKLVNLILLHALKDKASDIHIEPGEKTLRVRVRVDGALKLVMTPPKSILNALISRLKIMAQLDIAERFAPQDGKFQIRYEGRTIDFRLSILPVVGGEKAVMRILDGGNLALKLESMGYEPRALEDIRKAINAAYGMMLVTGPTGSGKSTTLYSCVHEVATARRQRGHGRGSGRVPHGRHQPGARQSQARHHLRRRAAFDPAPGPGRDPGRRNPRHRDGRHRDQGGAHGPPGALHAAHQRRGLDHHATARHEDRPLHGLELALVHRGPAPGAQAVRELPPAAGAARERTSVRGLHARGDPGPEVDEAQPQRLRALQPGLPRALRDPRDALPRREPQANGRRRSIRPGDERRTRSSRG